MFRQGLKVEKSFQGLRNWKKGVLPLLSTFQQGKEKHEIQLRNKAEARACRASWVWLLFWKNEKTLQGFKQRSDLVWFALIKGIWERTWVKQEWEWRNQWRGCCKHPRGRREWAQRDWKEEGRQDAYLGGKCTKFADSLKLRTMGKTTKPKGWDPCFSAWGRKKMATQLNEMEMLRGGSHLVYVLWKLKIVF